MQNAPSHHSVRIQGSTVKAEEVVVEEQESFLLIREVKIKSVPIYLFVSLIICNSKTIEHVLEVNRLGFLQGGIQVSQFELLQLFVTNFDVQQLADCCQLALGGEVCLFQI